MTHVVKLFGDITAERTEKGTIIVRKGDELALPYEYLWAKQLTPKCWILLRAGTKRYDVMSGHTRTFFGAYHVQEIGRLGPDDIDDRLIALTLRYGTLIMDDWLHVRAFIPGYPRIDIIDGVFLVAYLHQKPEPRVRVYDLWGEFLAEDELWDAIEKARKKVGM